MALWTHISSGLLEAIVSAVSFSYVEKGTAIQRLIAAVLLQVFTGAGKVFLTDCFWNAAAWTQVTSDNSLVHELLQAYFSQETPQRIVLGTSPFLDNMANNHMEYCNPALVNAVLAVACTFNQTEGIFATSHECLEAGEAFYNESKWHLSQLADSVMDVQALGVLAKRDITIGDDISATRLSAQCMQLAYKLGLHRDPGQALLPYQSEGSSPAAGFTGLATFFTNYYCDIIYCILTNTASSLDTGNFDDLVSYKQALTSHLKSCIDSTTFSFSHTLRYGLWEEVAVMVDLFELSLIIQDNLKAFYQFHEPLTQKIVLNLYSRYQQWHEALLEHLTLSDDSPQRVLILQCHYFVAILLLFRPFCKVDFIQNDVSPRKMCLNAAGMISDIMDALALRNLLRQTSPAMCVFYLSSANLQLAGELPSREASVYLRRNIRVLRSMLSWNPTARQSLDYFADLVEYNSIVLDEESMAALEEARKMVDGNRAYLAHRETMQGLLIFMDQHTQGPEGSLLGLGEAKADSERAMRDRGFVWSFPET